MSAQRASTHLAMKVAKNLPPLENSSDFRLWEEAIVNVCHDIKASTGNQSVHNKVFEHHNQANAAPPNDDEQSHRFAMMLMKMSSGDVARTIIAAVEQRQPGANNNYALTALRELRQHFQSQQAANRQRIERDINNLSLLLQFRKPELTESTAIDLLFSDALIYSSSGRLRASVAVACCARKFRLGSSRSRADAEMIIFLSTLSVFGQVETINA